MPLLAQAPAESPEKEQIEGALKLTTEAARKYELRLADDGETAAKLVEKPILRWSNPAVGEVHGNVFLWTDGKRPVAVGSLFKWFSPHTHMSHEFQSLSETQLSAQYDGANVWTTDAAGVSFAPVPDAPSPASTAPLRLSQMRGLAKSLTARKTDRDGAQQELRLLTQPVHRYAQPQQGVVDGALFVFVEGTDPEVWLLLEARETGGKSQWMFAAARMNSVAFELSFAESSAWKVDALPSREVYGHQRSYTSFLFKMEAGGGP